MDMASAKRFVVQQLGRAAVASADRRARPITKLQLDATLPYLKALENFSRGIGIEPEQIWDGPDVPPYLRFGGATDAAMALLWAHSIRQAASLCCRP